MYEIFHPSSAVSPRKTPTQELKGNFVVLTLCWVSVTVFLMQPAYSRNRYTPWRIAGSLLYNIFRPVPTFFLFSPPFFLFEIRIEINN
jgi:hypothetical protein